MSHSRTAIVGALAPLARPARAQAAVASSWVFGVGRRIGSIGENLSELFFANELERVTAIAGSITQDLVGEQLRNFLNG